MKLFAMMAVCPVLAFSAVKPLSTAKEYEVAVIGGGAAGIAAALQSGFSLPVHRDGETFEELGCRALAVAPGVYAALAEEAVRAAGCEIRFFTTVTSIARGDREWRITRLQRLVRSRTGTGARQCFASCGS